MNGYLLPRWMGIFSITLQKHAKQQQQNVLTCKIVNSSKSYGCVYGQSLSHILLFATPWTVAHQAPLSMGFSRQESWSGLPCPPPGDLPDPGIEPESPALQVDSLPLSHQGSPKHVIKVPYLYKKCNILRTMLFS